MTTEADARAELIATGASLVITSTYAYDSVVPEGHVISMTPAADTLVAPDETVVLVVSLGPAPASRFTGSNAVAMQAAAANAVQSGAPSVAPIVMSTHVFLDIEDDPIYANDSPCTFRWGGSFYVPDEQDWVGVGKYGSIESVSEALDLVAQPVRLTISGVDSAILEDAMTSQYAGRTAAVYLALHDPRDLSLIDTPEEIWSGRMAVMKVKFGQNHGSVTVECEHRLRKLATAIRYTDEDQRTRHSGDLFFNHLHEIPGYVSKWGSRDQRFSGGGGRRDDRPDTRPH